MLVLHEAIFSVRITTALWVLPAIPEGGRDIRSGSSLDTYHRPQIVRGLRGVQLSVILMCAPCRDNTARSSGYR